MRAGLALHWGPPRDHEDEQDFDIGIICRVNHDSGSLQLARQPVRDQPETPSEMFRVAILMTASAVEELLADDNSAGALALRKFAAGQDSDFKHELTPRARLALESIRLCPFVGVCRTMALTARCHDLLVEFLTAWTTSLQTNKGATGPEDAIRLAAEILERELEHPPTLASLASRIGLSETSLKRAFPRIFGMTVFGYLRQCRMLAARRMIESGSATVMEAAAKVGYSNPSNFTAAFRREFGINPKTHQLSTRR